jgi:SNF2 family DNA or RNA helicase
LKPNGISIKGRCDLERYRAEEYQKKGIQLLCSNPGFGLLAYPGTGKTGMTLAAFVALKRAGLVGRALIVAPRLVVHNTWPAEIQKWIQFNHLSFNIIHGENKDQKLFHEAIQPRADFTLTNPESLKWFFGMFDLKWFTSGRMKWPWDVLVIDESSKFKNPGSVRFKVLKPFLPLFTRRIILTGTPTPASMEDLWSQMFIVDGGDSLGKTLTEFRGKYFQIDNPKYYTYKLLPGAAEAIHRAIAGKVCVFDESAFNLPPRVTNDVVVTLPTKARKIYDDFEKLLFGELDSGQVITAPNSSSKYLLCRQIANGRMYEPKEPQPLEDAPAPGRVVHSLHSEKIEAVENLLDELNGKPVLIAYHFRHDLEALVEFLSARYKAPPPFIGAGVPMATINHHIEQWNRGGLPVLLVHPASMAHGLNLQFGGNDLIFYSLTDNLENYQQLIKRLHRRGVVGQVRIHRIIAAKTVDEAVVMGLDDKASNQAALMEAVKRYRMNQTPRHTAHTGHCAGFPSKGVGLDAFSMEAILKGFHG